MKHFGERIRELRKERGITNYEMATRLGISRNTLTNWERCEKEPHTLEIFEEMAKILNVSLKSLLEGKNEDELGDVGKLGSVGKLSDELQGTEAAKDGGRAAY